MIKIPIILIKYYKKLFKFTSVSSGKHKIVKNNNLLPKFFFQISKTRFKIKYDCQDGCLVNIQWDLDMVFSAPGEFFTQRWICFRRNYNQYL